MLETTTQVPIPNRGIPFTLASGRVVRTAIVYIRVSTAREDMKSPEQQLSICQFYAAAKNIQIVDVVPDLDLSGADFAKRKIGDIIERVRNNEADAIIVWEYSRFGRTLVGSLYYIKQLGNAGGELLSATQDIDATTPAGRYMRDQFLRLAEYQLDTITDGWKSTHKRRIENGLPHSGQARFGYQRCPGCYKPEENSRFYLCKNKCGGLLVPEHLADGEAERALRSDALGRGYLMFAEGASMYQIQKDAWEKGIVSLRGNRMDESAWRAVLDSGFGAGLLRGRTDKTTRPTNTRPDIYDVWGDGAHDAVTSQEIWDAYVERRIRQANEHVRSNTPKFHLSALIRCGDLTHKGTPCLRSMKIIGQTRKGKETIRYFTCTHDELHVRGKMLSMGMHRIDVVVLEWLTKMAKGGEGMAQVSMERAAKAEKSASEIPAVKKALEVLERKRQRINEGYEAGLTELEEAKAKMAAVKVEISDLKTKLRRLESEAATNRIPEREVFQGLLAVWDRATPTEKRRALSKVVDHVRITPPRESATKGSDAMVIPLWADDSERVLNQPFRRKDADSESAAA
ncbi:recombinase family protein [Streptomyces sp. NBC_01456]|uniref:recombinase family protein n=1 Tax=Streptomyces sp. NBC_01456 TaxID=2975868 RepID=UPI002E2F0BBD|nr:recombinase family protein [Streptomyces sp. NBC_01456]